MSDRYDGELEDEQEAYEYEDGELEPYRRPWWMAVVAAIVLIGLVIAAVPSFLWPWIILVAFIAFLLWRAVSPRSPRA